MKRRNCLVVKHRARWAYQSSLKYGSLLSSDRSVLGIDGEVAVGARDDGPQVMVKWLEVANDRSDDGPQLCRGEASCCLSLVVEPFTDRDLILDPGLPSRHQHRVRNWW